MVDKTTAQDILRNKPNTHDVDRVESLWRDFSSTTQFLEALRQAMLRAENANEAGLLEPLIPAMAEVEAQDLNELAESFQKRTYVGDFWKDSCWREPGAAQPITQRSKVG